MKTLRLLLLLLAALLNLTACISWPQLVQTVPSETNITQHQPPTQAVWLEMIGWATQTIELEQFYVSSKPGEGLEPIISALRKAAKRGVKIRILLSNALVKPYQKTIALLREFAEVRILDLRKRTQKKATGIIHAKYWIIDDSEVFLGSQNFDWRALSHIHELGLRLGDPGVISGLERIFEIDWALAAGQKPPAKLPARRTGDPDIELVASPPLLNPAGIRHSLPALLALIGKAKQSLKIQLLSYYLGSRRNPWRAIDDALRAAASRGVKIRLLVSDWLTKKYQLEQLTALHQQPNIEVRVGAIPLHSSGKIPFARVIHSKYMTVDGKTLWLGTSNWSKGYFTQSRNVALILRKPELTRSAAQIHDTLWNGRYVKPITEWAKSR